MPGLPPEFIEKIVAEALAEDVGAGDATTLAAIPPPLSAAANMIARESLVVAGIELAAAAFRLSSPALEITRKLLDGARAAAGEPILQVRGLAQPILSAERVALNFIQRLSGVATLTAQFVKAVRGTRAQILDTRKTTPGWRRLEKYAVRCGGGRNHRFGLFDQVLIKDNHLAALARAEPNAIAAAVARARVRFPSLKIEVEADSLAQAAQAAEAGADIILLDNMTPEQMRQAVALVAGRALTEASGGVRLEAVRAIAESGVDLISVGALTHSAPAADIGLDFLPNAE